MATWTNRTFGLAAGAALLALAGCSAPQGPETQTADYYAEPPPPPLMGGRPQAQTDHTGLAGGPPAPVSGQPLPAAGPQDGVITFRRADGVLVTTMRPVANPEDMAPAERAEVYGAPRARAAAPRAYAEAPALPRVASADVAKAPPRAERAAAAPVVKPAPAPKTAQKAVPAPAPKPAAPIQTAPAPDLAGSPDAPAAETGGKSGGLFAFLERFKFWDRDDAAEAGRAAERAAEQAAQTAGEAAQTAGEAAQNAGEAAETAAADVAQEAGSGISGRTVLLALAVVAAVLILAAISRNAAARRREDARRRRFRTFGYGGDDETQDDKRGPSLAAPLAAAAAGMAAGAAVANAHDSRKEERDEARADAEAAEREDAQARHDEHEPA